MLLTLQEYSRNHRPVIAGVTALLPSPTDRAAIRPGESDRKTGCPGIKNYSQFSR